MTTVQFSNFFADAADGDPPIPLEEDGEGEDAEDAAC